MQPITDRPRELVIRSEEEDTGQVRVIVTDCGVGFSADSADRLFNTFFTTKSGGMGMGLLDLSLDHRVTRGPNLGRAPRASRCDCPIHPAFASGGPERKLMNFN